MIRTRMLKNYISYVQIEIMMPIADGGLHLIHGKGMLNYAAFGKVLTEDSELSGKVVLFNALTAKKVSVLGQEGLFVREDEVLCEVVLDSKGEFDDNGKRYKLKRYEIFDVSGLEAGNNTYGQASKFSI